MASSAINAGEELASSGDVSRSKQKRSALACAECRGRKQRCSGPTSIPCERCAAARRACSFESDLPRHPTILDVSTLGGEERLKRLEEELLQHKQRLDDLEQLLGATAPISDASNGTVFVALGSQNGFAPAGSAANSTTQLRGTDVAVPLTPFLRQQPASTGRENEPRDTSLRGLDIEAPATFMRSVQSRISTREPSLQAARATSKDPVKTALIDMNQAQQLFEIFWRYCSPLCNVLCPGTQRQAFAVSAKSPLLFTIVLSIAARHWDFQSGGSNLHPAYAQIVDMVDAALSELLLQPALETVQIETVQALLLYCQYSPLRMTADAGRQDLSLSQSSNLLVISLTLRFAQMLRLGEQAANFPTSASAVSQKDLMLMRVWANLLSVDHLVSLSANLVPSLDPLMAARGVRDFGDDHRTRPADRRLADLYEIILIVHRLSTTGFEQPLAQIGTTMLKRANDELAEWERRWRPSTLFEEMEGVPHVLHALYTFPSISLSWYRIALNSASAGARSHSESQMDEGLTLLKASLAIAVEAAARMLWLCAEESLHDNSGKGYLVSSIQPFKINEARAMILAYSVDSYWLNHSFSAALLAIAFDRGAIDSHLRLQSPPRNSLAAESSPLLRLLTVATKLVEYISQSALHHPSTIYLPYFNAALQTCRGTSQIADDSSLQIFHDMLGSGNINLDLFQNSLFTQAWDGSMGIF